MSAAATNTVANPEVLAKLFFYNLYDQLAAVAAASSSTATGDDTGASTPTIGDHHHHHPHRPSSSLSNPDHSATHHHSDHALDPTADHHHHASPGGRRSPSDATATAANMEPPTPPRTPVTQQHPGSSGSTSATSAATVSAIMENLQHTLSQRFEQLAAAAAAATNHQRNASTMHTPHPLISVTPAAKLMATTAATSHHQHQHSLHQHQHQPQRASTSAMDSDSDNGSPSVGGGASYRRHHSFHDEDADEDYTNAGGHGGDEDDDNSSLRAFDLSFRYNNLLSVGMASSSHDDSNLSGASGGGDNKTAVAQSAMSFLSATPAAAAGSSSSAGFNASSSAAEAADKFNAAESARYLSHYASYLECGHDRCTADNQREHYHCYDIICLGKVLAKKEEIIRHLKWHKKRNESLNHGFLRFSSGDDCAPQYSACTHNRKQTHYHCLQPNCDKVYISTSDVQMHSNYHRKDSAIIQEGFQRFRATEQCGAPEHCVFAGQRTTHFHCRRSGCRYTFKNKADMEKHKTYHIKDEQLSRDGFKKFLKTEQCPYERCRFSRICNHIHCVREGCFYVLHSSGQLLSHKRKHDRIDSEQAYRRFKMAQQSGQSSSSVAGPSVTSPTNPLMSSSFDQLPADLSVSLLRHRDLSSDERSSDAAVDLSAIYSQNASTAARGQPTTDLLLQIQQQQQFAQRRAAEAAERMDTMATGEPMVDANDSTLGRILTSNRTQPFDENEAMLVRTYFTDSCQAEQRSRDPSLPHAVCHMFEVGTTHLHCLLRGCDSKAVRRTMAELTAHLREHQHQLPQAPAPIGRAVHPPQQQQQVTSIDGFFNRKRGRPPKNRVVEVYNNIQQSPQAIFTSFKLEKGATSVGNNATPTITAALQRSQPHPMLNIQQQASIHPLHPLHPLQPTVVESPVPTDHKFHFLQPHEICPDGPTCRFAGLFHFHCTDAQRRCHFATNYAGDMDRHTTGFHATVQIRPHFEFYDRHANCGRSGCTPAAVSVDHFHCQLCNASMQAPNDQLTHMCAVEGPPRSQFNSSKLSSSSNNNNNDYSMERPKSAASSDDGGADEGQSLLMDGADGSSGVIGSVSGGAMADDEKVLVVRAAGTYFPGGESSSPPLASANTSTESPKSSTSEHLVSPAANEIVCQRPFCKLKRKPHVHCDLCNQAFSEEHKLKAHYLKHQSSNLMQQMILKDSSESEAQVPQDLSTSAATAPTDSPSRTPTRQSSVSPSPADEKHSPVDQMMSSPSFVDSMTLQNLHLAQLAHFYQQNPYYYQNLYPFLGPQGVSINRADMLQAQLDQQQQLALSMAQQQQLNLTGTGLDLSAAAATGMPNEMFLAMAAAAAAASSAAQSPNTSHLHKTEPVDPFDPPSAKRQKTGRPSGGCGQPSNGSNFKMFKDEPIPQGYLKFRFNEDCQFANCGYRNHQSHFHCCRNDCFYSFCDKTRFVQHTARHERLDKLMGDDFKQYRANMRCGYEECAYNKNMGANNKSSHFHCMKCAFICSDTNKVVAHRRQHSKLDYIRQAGFRKVANNEPCLTTEQEVAASASEQQQQQQHGSCGTSVQQQPASPASSTSSTQHPAAAATATGGALVECNYSLKQMHYHCLVCNGSVLSRAQLGSHRHRV